MLENLHRTKEMGVGAARCCEAGDLEGYAELMHEHWQNKRERSPGMADEHIDSLYTLARRSRRRRRQARRRGRRRLPARLRAAARRHAPGDGAAGVQELPFDFDFQGAIGEERDVSAASASSAAA